MIRRIITFISLLIIIFPITIIAQNKIGFVQSDRIRAEYEEFKDAEAQLQLEYRQVNAQYNLMVGPEGELYRRQAQLEFDILSKVKRAVDKIAAAKKIDFILDGSTSLLYGNPTYDLTDDVLFELRKYSVSDKDKKTQEK